MVAKNLYIGKRYITKFIHGPRRFIDWSFTKIEKNTGAMMSWTKQIRIRVTTTKYLTIVEANNQKCNGKVSEGRTKKRLEFLKMPRTVKIRMTNLKLKSCTGYIICEDESKGQTEKEIKMKERVSTWYCNKKRSWLQCEQNRRRNHPKEPCKMLEGIQCHAPLQNLQMRQQARSKSYNTRHF